MRIKYKNSDGRAKIWNGPLHTLKSKPFVDKIFGPLERPLTRDEQINPTTGAIEPRAKSSDQIDDESERAEIRKMRVLEVEVLTVDQLRSVVKWLVKREVRRVGDK